MRAAIIIALEEELSNAFDCLENHGKFFAPKQSLKEGQSNFQYLLRDGQTEGLSYPCEIFLINGMGNVAASAFVGRSMNFDPSILISVGISGTLMPDEISLEDVVISNQVKYYAPDKIGEFTSPDDVIVAPVSDTAPGEVDGKYRVDERDLFGSVYLRFVREHIILKEFSPVLDAFLHRRSQPEAVESVLQKNGKLVRGTILGSNWVVDSKKYADYIDWKNQKSHLDYYKLNKPQEYLERCSWGQSDLHAVDMETYGFFKALDFFNKTRELKIPGFAIRGISDKAAGKSDLDDQSGGSHRAKAVENAMLVTIEFLRFFFREKKKSGRI